MFLIVNELFVTCNGGFIKTLHSKHWRAMQIIWSQTTCER